jgi:hypothetical protein
MMALRVRSALCLGVFLCAGGAAGQESPRKPEVTIERDGNITNFTSAGAGSWRPVITGVLKLREIPRESDAYVISTLTAEMDDLPPLYLYELVRRTCISDPERASYLFGLAGMRLRYDAYRCVDASAKAGVHATVFALQMPECGSMLSDLDLSLKSLRKLRDAKELFSSKASPWWICSHGMAAMQAGLEKRTLDVAEWLKPESEWEKIREQVRGDIDYTIDKHSKK